MAAVRGSEGLQAKTSRPCVGEVATKYTICELPRLQKESGEELLPAARVPG